MGVSEHLVNYPIEFLVYLILADDGTSLIPVQWCNLCYKLDNSSASALHFVPTCREGIGLEESPWVLMFVHPIQNT